MGCHDHGIDLHLIWTIERIIEYFLHRYAINIRSRSYKSRHHMSHYLESCIFEESCCTDRFRIPMPTLIKFIDTIIRCLVANLYSCHSVATQSYDLCLIDPIRSSLDRHSDHSTFCCFIAFLGFFEGSREFLTLCISWFSGDRVRISLL